MKFHKLGRTGQDISVICLGTMTFGEQNSQADGFEQMDYALEQGVNFFDTAELYSVPPRAETTGSTERIIGEWFSARGTRNKVILASKVAGAGAFTFMRDKQEPTRLNRAVMSGTSTFKETTKRCSSTCKEPSGKFPPCLTVSLPLQGSTFSFPTKRSLPRC